MDEEWDLQLRPYFWLPKISGTVTVNGLGGKAKITQGQIWRSLDSAFLLNLYAAKGDTMFRVDAISFAISDDSNIQGIPGGSVDGRLEMSLAEVDAGVRVIHEDDEELDVYAGPALRLHQGAYQPEGRRHPGAVREPRLGRSHHRLDLPARGRRGLDHAVPRGLRRLRHRQRVRPHLPAGHALRVHGGGPWSFGFGYRFLMIDNERGKQSHQGRDAPRFSGPVAGASYRF